MSTPRFEAGREMKIAGLRQQHQTATMGTIADQWAQLQPLMPLPHQTAPSTYGVTCTMDEASGVLDYLAGAEVNADEDTGELASIIIPAADYAVFDFQCPETDFQVAYGVIFGGWLPTAKFAIDDKPIFERYPPEFDPQAGTGPFEIWVPITPKG